MPEDLSSDGLSSSQEITRESPFSWTRKEEEEATRACLAYEEEEEKKKAREVEAATRAFLADEARQQDAPPQPRRSESPIIHGEAASGNHPGGNGRGRIRDDPMIRKFLR